MNSTELTEKFGMHITGHHQIKPIDFGEYQLYSFFTGVQKKKKNLIRYGLWSQIL